MMIPACICGSTQATPDKVHGLNTMTVDYSVWLTPERLEVEEKLWEEVAIYELYAERVVQTADKYRCLTVLEVGCGTGWVPTRLPAELVYGGIDANPDCVHLARQKNPDRDREIYCHDVRAFAMGEPADLVCSFAVLKHFALDEWAQVVGRVLSLGGVGLFTMNIGPVDADDFEQGYPHTWVRSHTLAAAVSAAGHQVESMEVLHTGETLITTRRT